MMHNKHAEKLYEQTDRQTDTVQYSTSDQGRQPHICIHMYRHTDTCTDVQTHTQGNMPIPVMYTYNPGLHAWAVSYRVCYIIRLVNIESE